MVPEKGEYPMKQYDKFYSDAHTWPVENIIKIKNSRLLAQWKIYAQPKLKKRITLYIGEIWDECNPTSKSISNLQKLYGVDPLHDPDNEWQYVQRFLNRMIELYLTELCCMERFREGSRITNRCHPSPCACEDISRSLLENYK